MLKPRKCTIAVIQARMGSSRLPGKVMMNLAGKPVIQWVIERVQACEEIDSVVVAIPDSYENKKLAEFCINKLKVGVFKGNESDVLDRTHRAAYMLGSGIYGGVSVVDITADCPLVDPYIISELIQVQRQNHCDYVSNVITRTWPDGFDVQVYDRDIYSEVNRFVADKQHRQHSGWNIINYSYIFSGLKVINVPAPKQYSFPEWGLTLDTKEDFDVLERIIKVMPDNFTAKDIIDLIKSDPELYLSNQGIIRNIPGKG